MRAHAKQHTIRNVPPHVARALMLRARKSGKSFNQVAVEALSEAAGDSRRVYDDLDFMVGTMSQAEAAAIDYEIEAQRRIDAEIWR
jgi:hypothetical protein